MAFFPDLSTRFATLGSPMVLGFATFMAFSSLSIASCANRFCAAPLL